MTTWAYYLGEGLRGFLGQVVPDAALDHPVRDGGHGDGRKRGEPPLQVVVLRFARGQAEPPAVIVDHDSHVIGVVEGGRAAREGCVVEVPMTR